MRSLLTQARWDKVAQKLKRRKADEEAHNPNDYDRGELDDYDRELMEEQARWNDEFRDDAQLLIDDPEFKQMEADFDKMMTDGLKEIDEMIEARSAAGGKDENT